MADKDRLCTPLSTCLCSMMLLHNLHLLTLLCNIESYPALMNRALKVKLMGKRYKGIRREEVIRIKVSLYIFMHLKSIPFYRNLKFPWKFSL